jgi:uncharacterized protein (TIGR04255 family)
VISRPKDLPDFRKPPVAETVLSLQFEPISGLTSPHLGVLWSRFRQELPLIEEHPQLPPVFEKFDPPSPAQVEVTIEEKPPLPRVWFVNDTKTELIQMQVNRFIHNWRKVEGMEPYPHYEPIREKFRSEVAVLEEFLREEKLGRLAVNQCEVTYVNHVEPSGVWDRHGQLEKVFSMWSGLVNASFLPDPEDAGLHMRFVIPDETGQPIGRLHVVVHPAWKKTDNSPILALNLTARGGPIGDGIEGAFAFFDLARKWIVKGFADLTTPEMQRVWERIDA